MAHDDLPTPPALVAPPALAPRAVRALVSTVARVTYPYLLGGGVSYLALTVVSRDLGLMFAGALLVLYGFALSKALQGQRTSGAHASERGTDGAP